MTACSSNEDIFSNTDAKPSILADLFRGKCC